MYEEIGPNTTAVATNTAVKSEPNWWYNIRMRMVGDDIRVWRRADDGSWPSPVLGADDQLSGVYRAAGYGFSIDAPTGGRATYNVDNFRVRPYDGAIDTNIGEIDVNALTLDMTPGATGSVVPSGGLYPVEECVYLRVVESGDYVFDAWGGLDVDSLDDTGALDLELTMDGAVSLAAEMRERYCGSGASYGSAPYDSTYAPDGYAPVTFDGLVETWTDGNNVPHEYVPAKLILTVRDYPDDDPLREVVIDGVGDTEENGVAKMWNYPVGTEILVRAVAKTHPAGFGLNLFAITTSPGTAINNCPTPEKRHTFYMPPVDTGNFTLNVVAPVVEHTVTATFPSGVGASFDCALSEGIADLTFNDTGYEESYSYEVLAPGGAIETVQSSCFDFQESFQSPAGLANPRSGQPVRWADGIGFYYPEDYSTRQVLIEFIGYCGDTKLLYHGHLVSSTITVPSTTDITDSLVAANNPLSPGSGSMLASENTAIIAVLADATETDGTTTRTTADRVSGVEPVGLDLHVDAIRTGFAGGYILGHSNQFYDPGDPLTVRRPGVSVTLTGMPAPRHTLYGWEVDGETQDSTTTCPAGVTVPGGTSGPISTTIILNFPELVNGFLMGCSTPKYVPVMARIAGPVAYVVSGGSTLSGAASTVAPVIQSVTHRNKNGQSDGWALYGGDRTILETSVTEEHFTESLTQIGTGYNDVFPSRIDVLYTIAHGATNGQALEFSGQWLTRAELQALSIPKILVAHITACDGFSSFTPEDFNAVILMGWSKQPNIAHVTIADKVAWEKLRDGVSFHNAVGAANTVIDTTQLTSWYILESEIPKMNWSRNPNASGNLESIQQIIDAYWRSAHESE